MKWIDKCYSRLLIDSHITDQKPEFMRDYDPLQYASMVELAGVDASMVYACDHNGNCYYPTKVGHIHANLAGRDIFGEVISHLRQRGIAPVAYYTVVYHNDAARRFPEAVIIDPVGRTHDGRYHYVCPNHPEVVEFFKAQIAEILAYEVEGIFIDMTFWPSVCCCEGCRRKFGKPVPESIGWANPDWVEFQRFREETMAQFAQELTDWCRMLRADITVTHQFSPVLHGWALGQSSGIARASDYASGDFYGSKLQQRFAVKVFDAFTQCPPFEFMTSRCVDLHDHTSTKSPDEMFLSALTTLANGGAYFFIDAISPSGSLSEAFYQVLAKTNRRLQPFKECVAAMHPRLWAKVGLYFSMPSCVDTSRNGVKLKALDDLRGNNMAIRQNAVLDETMGTAEILTKLHVPYRIITDITTDLADIKTIIVNNAAYLTSSECQRLREFVADGGMLIATGATSLYSYRGDSTGDFTLADVFGVEFTGRFSQDVTYSGEEDVLALGRTPLVKTTGAEVRAYLTFTDFPPYDAEHYASIHSNPPSSIRSEYPAVTWHPYGRGGSLWIAAPILVLQQFTQQEYGKKLLSPLLPALVVRKENLPSSMEITLLKGNNEWLLCLVNWQNELPVIPLHNVTIALQAPFIPEKAIRIADGKDFAFHFENGILTLNFPKITEGEFVSFRSSPNE